MKRVLIAVAGAVLVPALIAGSAGAGAGVKAPQDCADPENRPNRLLIACKNEAIFVNSIHWDVWKSNKAKGEGVLQVGDCAPSCAGGSFDQYPVKIVLSDPRDGKCNGERVNAFRKVEFKYLEDRPPYADIILKQLLCR
jgi:hypothetical protein